MSLGHAEWIGERSLGHRLWEAGATFAVGETGDVIARPGADPARGRAAAGDAGGAGSGRLPRRARRAPRGRADAGDRRGDGRRAARDRRCSPRARTTSSPATCSPPWCRCWPRSRSAPPCAAPAAPASLAAAVLVVYSLGFSILASADPSLQRPDWKAVAARAGRTERAAGDDHLDPRRGLAALLPLDRLLPGAAVRRLRLGRARNRLRLPGARRRRFPAACSGRASARSATSGPEASG